MFANPLTLFGPIVPEESRRSREPDPSRNTPVFIGDAVQPWGSDTLLLEVIRRDREAREDQP